MVKAMYDYEAASDGELNVQENDILHLYDRDGEWFFVKSEGDDSKIGHVPDNYVEDVRIRHFIFHYRRSHFSPQYIGEEEAAPAAAALQIVVPDSVSPALTLFYLHDR